MNNKNVTNSKITPQAIEAEKAVLSAMMIDEGSAAEVMDILRAECFYDSANREIFSSIRKLFINNTTIDLLTISDSINKDTLKKIGGKKYLAEISNKVSSSGNIETHARIILQEYIKRKLIEISKKTMNNAFDSEKDVFDILDKAEGDITEISEGMIKNPYRKIDLVLEESIQHLKYLRDKDETPGVPTGFQKLDEITSGWQETDMIVMAGRPGMGKTAFSLSIAVNSAIKSKIPTAFFSLEMGAKQLANRIISSETGIDSKNLRRANLKEHEWIQLETKIQEIKDAPFFIDDTPALSIFELRSKCRKLVRSQKVKLVIVDYLQLMTLGLDNKRGNREQEISLISRSIKQIAKELDISIIAISQLSRAVETRSGGNRPMLSDLRESGAIEQDADLVLFVYRPEYYGFDEWPENAPRDKAGTSCEGQAEIIVAKHRNGDTGSVVLDFHRKYAKFIDHDELSVYDKNTIQQTSRLNDEEDIWE